MYQLKIFDHSLLNGFKQIELKINEWFMENPNIKVIRFKRTGSIATIIYKVKEIKPQKELNLKKNKKED